MNVAIVTRCSNVATRCGLNFLFHRPLPRHASGVRVSLLAALLVTCSIFCPLAQSQTSDGEEGAIGTYPHIFIATADGSQVWPLTEGLGPSWSPDGTRIAFYREAAEHWEWDMFITDVKAGGDLEAGGSGGFWLGSGKEPAWSPDGRWIAFTSLAGISLLEASQSRWVTILLQHDFLTGPPRVAGCHYCDMAVGKPSWSPDGTQIAFEHLGDGDELPAQIYSMKADGTDVRRLSSPSERWIWYAWYAQSDPAWSPDGSRIALWSYFHGLATISSAGSTPNRVYFDKLRVGYGASPAWSPDGSTIAFVVNSWRQEGKAIWVVDRAGGTPRELIPNAYDPAWSPDGNYIAFVSDLPGPAPPHSFPPDPNAASIYVQNTALLDWPPQSRYVFYSDETFQLQYMYSSGGISSLGGTYARTSYPVTIWDIILSFDGSPEWQAGGRFSDDDSTLTVEYSGDMWLEGFEDGIYVLMGQSTEGAVKEPDEPQPPPGPPPDPPPVESLDPPPGESLDPTPVESLDPPPWFRTKVWD
jgi:Tol biopolymer transport system component